jgi:GNAT superfamily N-acetyltransferase
MSIIYRRAGPGDVPAMADLPQPGEAGGDPPERMLRYVTGESHPRQALPPRAMWIAEANGAPIGYAAGHLTRRFDCDGELQWIYVVREHRRSRVASELLRLLAGWFVDQRALRICVDVGDDAARPFYRRLGAVDLNKHWMVWNDISRLESLNGMTPLQ